MKHLQTSAGFIFITLSDKMLNFRRCSDYRKKVRNIFGQFSYLFKSKIYGRKNPDLGNKTRQESVKSFL